MDSTAVHLRIEDYGRSFDPLSVCLPDLDALPESGLGVYIMRSLMDEVTYQAGCPNVLKLEQEHSRLPWGPAGRAGKGQQVRFFTSSADGVDHGSHRGELDAVTVWSFARSSTSLSRRSTPHRDRSVGLAPDRQFGRGRPGFSVQEIQGVRVGGDRYGLCDSADVDLQAAALGSGSAGVRLRLGG